MFVIQDRYKYSYKFLADGDTKPRKLMIEDWEIGALYWNCLEQCRGDEKAANRLVRKKYFDEFCTKKDVYLFLGTTLKYHMVAPNPFVVIGVFFPPKPKDTNVKNISSSTFNTDNIQQQNLFDE